MASSIAERAPANGEFDQWLETVLQATQRHVSQLSESFVDSPERRRAELAALKFALEYLVEVGPPHPVEVQQLKSQIRSVVEEGRARVRNLYSSLDAHMLDRALTQFEERLISQCYLELNPLLCRPVPESRAQESLESWRQSMNAIRGPLEAKYAVYGLDPNTAPAWEYEKIQENKTTILRETLSTYLDIRRGSFVLPTEELTKLHEEFENAARQVPKPIRDDIAREMNRKRTRGDWDIDVQEYEVLAAIYDTLSPINRFQPIVDQDRDQVLLWASFPASYPSIAVPFDVEYVGDDNVKLLDDVRAELSGFLTIAENGRVRTELTDRSPLWRGRGICYEPIGATIEWARNEMRVYQPGAWEFDTFAVSKGSGDWPDRRPTLLVPSGRRIKAESVNRLLVAPGQIVKWEENADTRTVNVEVEWREACPSLYALDIPRARYTYGFKDGKQTLLSGEFYCDNEKTVAAEIKWRKPVKVHSLPDAFLEVEMKVHEPALLDPRAHPGDQDLIINPRIVTWEYRISDTHAGPVLVPSKFAIQTNTGEFVLSVNFGEPRDADDLTLPDDLAVPVAYVAPDSAYRLEHYRLQKEYFRELREHDAQIAALPLDSFIERGEALAGVAAEYNDEDMLYAAQRLLRDWYANLEDYSALVEVTKENLALTARIADDKQFSFEAGTAINKLTQCQRYADVVEMIDTLADTMRMRTNAPYLVEKGSAALAVRESAQAAACFTAAAMKLESDTPLRQQALLGCISAWRKLKDDFCSSNAGADHCQELALRINKAIEEYMVHATDEDRQDHADLLS